MGVRLFTNARSDQVSTFCNQGRRAVAGGVVGQGHGKVRRVRNHHVGIFDVSHHALIGHLPLTTTNLGLHLRATFDVFVFVLNFLLGHAHAFHELMLLPWDIDTSDHNQRQGYVKR